MLRCGLPLRPHVAAASGRFLRASPAPMPIRTTAATALEGGYELSLLFLLFLGINIAWECLLGLLRFVNSFTGGRGTLWIERVKEEMLSLGVIVLVLVMIEPQLEKICVHHDGSDYYEGAGNMSAHHPPPASVHAGRHPLSSGHDHHPCPEGSVHLFPKVVITASHYLLFYIAVVHIVYTFLSFVLMLQRFRRWVLWEHEARVHSPRPLPLPYTDDTAAMNPDAGKRSTKAGQAQGTACSRGCRCLVQVLAASGSVVCGGVSRHVFLGLRHLFLAKAALALLEEGEVGPSQHQAPPAPGGAEHPDTRQGSNTPPGTTEQHLSSSNEAACPSGGTLNVPPGLLPYSGPLPISVAHSVLSLHFANAAEQLAELELTRAWAHTWALALLTALFMLFFEQAWQAVWMSAVAIAIALIASIKMQWVLWSAARLGQTWPQELLAMHSKQQPRRLLRLRPSTQLAAAPPPAQLQPSQPAPTPIVQDVERGSTAGTSLGAQQEQGASSLATPGPGPTSAAPAPVPSFSATDPPGAAAYTFSSANKALAQRAKGLLWFKRPGPLLWLIDLATVINSLSITICIYVLVAYEAQDSYDRRAVLETWVPIIVADTLLAVYLGVVIMPQYALLSCACGHSYASVMKSLTSSRRTTHETEEHGLSGLLEHACAACFKRRVKHRHTAHPRSGLVSVDSGSAELLEVFIRGLAARAGVILPGDHHGPHAAAVRHPVSILPLYRQVARAWVTKAVQSGDFEADTVGTWGIDEAEVSAAVEVLQGAFSVIDEDASGFITLSELRERLVDVLETQPTTNELRAMVHTIDLDDNRQISMREMGVFCAHDYFSTGSLHPGTIDAVSLAGAFHELGLPPVCGEIESIKTLLSMATGQPAGTHAAVTLQQFAVLLQDVRLE